MPNNKQPMKKVVEEQITSERFQLVDQDWQKIAKNMVRMLKPLIVFVAALYLPQIQSSLMTPGHTVALADFTPSKEVITAVCLYIVNAVFDGISKWADTKQYTVVK